MGFERFKKRGRGYKPKVSIWMRGQIGFNQGAVERFKIKEYKYVIFFYDRDEKKIGFKFTNDENEEGISKINIRPTGATISAKAFLDFYEIPYEKTKQYDIFFDDKERLYVINFESE